MQNLFLPRRHQNSNPRPLLWAPMHIGRGIWAHHQYPSILEAKEEAIRTMCKSQIDLDHQYSQICYHLLMLTLANRWLYLRRTSGLLRRPAHFFRQADNPSAFETLHSHRMPACRPQVDKGRRLFLRLNMADKVDLGELNNNIQWNVLFFILCFWSSHYLGCGPRLTAIGLTVICLSCQ